MLDWMRSCHTCAPPLPALGHGGGCFAPLSTGLAGTSADGRPPSVRRLRRLRLPPPADASAVANRRPLSAAGGAASCCRSPLRPPPPPRPPPASAIFAAAPATAPVTASRRCRRRLSPASASACRGHVHAWACVHVQMLHCLCAGGRAWCWWAGRCRDGCACVCWRWRGGLCRGWLLCACGASVCAQC